MKSGNKSIRINGKSVEVTDEVYKVYTKYDRKMRYFEKDLKQERLVYDELGNIIKRVPSREDSLDRLLDESFMQFKDISENLFGQKMCTRRSIMMFKNNWLCYIAEYP